MTFKCPFPMSGGKRKNSCAQKIKQLNDFFKLFQKSQLIKIFNNKRTKKKKKKKKKKSSREKKENPEGLYTI
jgi:hypothetical protein